MIGSVFGTFNVASIATFLDSFSVQFDKKCFIAFLSEAIVLLLHAIKVDFVIFILLFRNTGTTTTYKR